MDNSVMALEITPKAMRRTGDDRSRIVSVDKPETTKDHGAGTSKAKPGGPKSVIKMDFEKFVKDFSKSLPEIFEKGFLDMKAIQEAPKLTQQELDEIESGKRAPPPITYDTPDQSTLKDGYDAFILRFKHTVFMDTPGGKSRPNGMPYLSDWYMTLYLGNLTDFNNMISGMTKEELDKKLQQREGIVQLCAIFLPIVGARWHFSENCPRLPIFLQHGHRIPRFPEYRNMEVFEKLIELGADINCQDWVGWTPLHHCLSTSRNDYTFKMAEKLLEAGANANIQNRFKETALFQPCIKKDLKAIDLLIKYKADPTLKDFQGVSVLNNMDVEVLTHLRVADKDRTKRVRDEAKDKTDFKKCGKCKADAGKRCMGCYLLWYCSSECQKSDWKSHKETCNKTRAQYEEIEIDMQATNENSSCESHKTGKIYKNSLKPAATSFIVKIAVFRDVFGKVVKTGSESEIMLVYNKERDAQFQMKAKTPFGEKLKKIIIDHDKTGLYKGYFFCFTKNGKFFVNPSILPEERW